MERLLRLFLRAGWRQSVGVVDPEGGLLCVGDCELDWEWLLAGLRLRGE